MSSMSKIAVVTGANQGLGFALAEGLAQQLAPEDVVYLTGRDPDRVRAAAARVAQPRARVRGEVFDVRDGAAVTAFADAIAARHGGVDVAFSNAAARLRPATPWPDLVGQFVDTNNLGATRMLRALDPILRAARGCCRGQRLRLLAPAARASARALRHRRDDARRSRR